MLIQTKIQLDPKDYEFVKKVYRDLHYKSLSEYMREAINARDTALSSLVSRNLPE